MLEADNHHGDPANGRQMGMSEDVREKFAFQDVVDLVETKQDTQHGRQQEIDQSRGYVPVQPVSGSQPGEDAGKVVDLHDRSQDNQHGSRRHGYPTRQPEVEDHARIADQHQKRLNPKPAL